jgi:hypothetical protein
MRSSGFTVDQIDAAIDEYLTFKSKDGTLTGILHPEICTVRERAIERGILLGGAAASTLHPLAPGQRKAEPRPPRLGLPGMGSV